MSFIGRSHEFFLLNQLVKKNTASMAVIYGRRRIGKSRLIEEFSRSIKTYSFSGLHPDLKMTREQQLNEFAHQASVEFGIKKSSYNDWSEAFYDISQRTKSGKVLIVLDEITWLGAKDANFLGKLKIAWDKYFKQNPQLILILCGSVSSWIDKNILLSTGFHGRISLTLRLRELPLKECKLFWGAKSKYIASYEKLKLLSVTGGIPKYLEEINPDLTAEQNIEQLAFLESGILFNDYRQIFNDSLDSHNSVYQEIVLLLVKGSLTQSDIAKELKMKTGGTLKEYLSNLNLVGFISQHHIWNLKTHKQSNLSYYRLSDNYLRFYLKYILPAHNQISSGHYKFQSFDTLHGWSAVAGLQVENLVLNNRADIIRCLGIDSGDITCDGPYVQRKTARKAGCQIDYLVQTKHNALYLCEVKFSRSTIGVDVISEVEQKISALAIPKNISVRPVLIHVGNLSDKLIDEQYFAKTIDLCGLLEEK